MYIILEEKNGGKKEQKIELLKQVGVFSNAFCT